MNPRCLLPSLFFNSTKCFKNPFLPSKPDLVLCLAGYRDLPVSFEVLRRFLNFHEISIFCRSVASVLLGARIKHTQLPELLLASTFLHHSHLALLLHEDGWAGGESFGLQLPIWASCQYQGLAPTSLSCPWCCAGAGPRPRAQPGWIRPYPTMMGHILG